MISCKEEIKDYIYNRRIVSVKNLCDYFDFKYEDVAIIIDELKKEKKVRTTYSDKCCDSSAKKCTGCSGINGKNKNIESMIVISLNKKMLLEE